VIAVALIVLLVAWALRLRTVNRPLAPAPLIFTAFVCGSIGFLTTTAPDRKALVIMAVFGLMGIAVSMFVAIGTLSPTWTSRYARRPSHKELTAKLVELALVVVTATMGFALLSAVLLDVNAITAAVQPHHGPRNYQPRVLFGFYLENLCQLIPLLEIPKTLNWNLTYFVDAGGGTMLLCYKLFVAIPIIQAVRLFLNSVRARAHDEAH